MRSSVSPITHAVNRMERDPKAALNPGNVAPLSSDDKALIEAATGENFNWPPGKDDLFPPEAIYVSLMRLRQNIEGMPYERLASKDLAAMHGQGMISKDFMDKALAYLAKQDSSTTFRSTPTAAAGPREVPMRAIDVMNARNTPGTATQDGSVYL